MTWDLRNMSWRSRVLVLVGSFVACAIVLAAAFKLLKKLGVL